MVKPGRVLADPARERIGTPATIVTFVRTAASITLAAYAASQGSKTLLVIALLVHWVGDSLDGQIARMFDCETRTGAVLDILSDRLCAAALGASAGMWRTGRVGGARAGRGGVERTGEGPAQGQ